MDGKTIALGLTAAAGAVVAAGVYFALKTHETTHSKTNDNTPKQQVPEKKPDLHHQQQVPETDERKPTISRPINLSKPLSITYDPERKRFEGVPEEIRQKIYDAGYTDEQVLQNPDLIKDILESFDYESIRNSRISSPLGVSHNIHLTVNERGEIEGIPAVIRDAITKKGITEQQIRQNPAIIQDLLYSFSLEEVLKDHLPKISKPFCVSHDFSISYDSATGEVKGLPEPVRKAIKDAGYTLQDVLKNPALIKPLLYNLDYETVKESTKPQVSSPTQCHHDFHITYDPLTGKISGIPEQIKQVCIEKGITEDQVWKDPSVVQDLIYSFNYDEVLKGERENV